MRQMENAQLFDDEDATSGLSVGEIQAVARRQFVASLFAGAVIVFVASLMALQPAHRDMAEAAPHRLAGIRHPSFVTPPGSRVAAMAQHVVELP
jgi:malonyl CoA-acyl carrier protein transacylase